MLVHDLDDFGGLILGNLMKGGVHKKIINHPANHHESFPVMGGMAIVLPT